MASGFDVSAWDTPQVALFEALGEVVDTVGARNAAYHAHRISSHTPSREFLERMRRHEVDSKLAQEVRMLLGESVQRYSLPHAASEAEAYQLRLRHLMVKEQILDTLSTDSGFVNQFLGEIQPQYEGTDLQRLAEAMVGMRGKVIMLERALGVDGEKMTPEEMKNKVAEWRAKAWDWDNYVTATGKKSTEAREVERGEGAERLAGHGGTDHIAEEPSAALIPISDPASPKTPPNQSDIEVKEDRKKQQAKLKKAIDANRLLQAKLRQVSDNRNRWSEYCEHLQKKLERSNALLKEHQVAMELVKTADPEEGGPSRPQTVEREEAVIDVVTPVKENDRPPAILPPAEQTYQSPYIPRSQAGAPRRAIQILPPNAKLWRDDENGRLPPLLAYGKHSAYWKDIGPWPDKKRGPRYSEDHPMARGGLHMAECSTDALEALEMIKPGEGFSVDDRMREALRTFKRPESGDSLAALHALVAAQEEDRLRKTTIGIDSDGGAPVSAEQKPGTSARFLDKLALFQKQSGRFQNQRERLFQPQPRIESRQVDLEALYMAVTEADGFDQVSQDKLGWRKVASRLGFTDDTLSDAANRLKPLYFKLLAAWEIKDMHGKEPPPKEELEDLGFIGPDRLTRVMMREDFHLDGDTETRQQDTDMADASGNTSEEGPAQAGRTDQSDMPSESASKPLSPKLPRLLPTTTVPDSLASSSSVSQHHTSSTQAEHPTSGADTINAEEVNQANATAAWPPPNDDEPPVVVSERNIRKRRYNGSPPKKKIKQERIESSPIALLGLRHLQTQESMDLDDIGPKTATPKKRREKRSAAGASGLSEEYAPAQVYQQAPTFTLAREHDEDEEDASDTPVPKPSPGTPSIPASASSILKSRSTNPILPRTSTKTYSAKCRRISDKGADLFSEDGENHLRAADSEEATLETPSKAVPRAVAGRLAGLLEKPSPRRWQVMNMGDEPDSASASDSNFTVQPPKAPSTKSTIAPRQTAHERLAAQRKAAQNPVGQDCHGRLSANGYDGILGLAEQAKSKQNKASDDKRPSPQRVHSNDGVDMRESRAVLQIAGKAEARSKKDFEDREAKHAKEARERRMQRKGLDVPSTARPEEEPSAIRPVSRLSLDDFRINPEYNNGLDYAYRDVVRGREKRKCLAGCTDPSCCGKGFRALAEIATPIRDSLTPAQKEEEDKLLTEFLGRNAARLIKHMGKEERRETLIKAKTRELANKHGKHRHAYERRKSPPGFWRTDFPTTQEEAEDREKAKEFERNLVQKRYEEAMRGGGKWIFKDQMSGQPDWVGKH